MTIRISGITLDRTDVIIVLTAGTIAGISIGLLLVVYGLI